MLDRSYADRVANPYRTPVFINELRTQHGEDAGLVLVLDLYTERQIARCFDLSKNLASIS